MMRVIFLSLLLALLSTLLLVSTERKCESLSERKVKSLLQDIRIYVQENELDEALKLIDEVLCAKPRELNALYYKGVIMYLKGNCDESLEILDEVIKRDPEFPQARFYRGLCLMQRGLYSKALEDLRRYNMAQREDPLGYLFRSRALWTLGQREKALEVLREGVNLTKSNLLRLELISLLIQLRRVEEAEELMRAAERAEMRRYQALRGDTAVKLAWFAFLMGDEELFERYLKLSEEAKRIDDKSKELLRALKSLSSEGMTAFLASYVNYKGSDPRIYYLIGLVALRLLQLTGNRAPDELSRKLYSVAINSFMRACQLDKSNLIYRDACTRLGIRFEEASESEESTKSEESTSATTGQVQASDSGVTSQGEDSK